MLMTDRYAFARTGQYQAGQAGICPRMATGGGSSPKLARRVAYSKVRDEKGRRRFHGAFTGGFSAGYFNSVGSKEGQSGLASEHFDRPTDYVGWAPSEFKSSRNNRANKVQRPEDFMDEEDLQQMNEDRQLQNTDTFKNEAFAGQRKPGDTSAIFLSSRVPN
jgi:hypothetical protein